MITCSYMYTVLVKNTNCFEAEDALLLDFRALDSVFPGLDALDVLLFSFVSSFFKASSYI